MSADHEQGKEPIAADKRKLFVDVQIENEKYLKAHPEVHALFSAVTRRILLNRPHDVVEYATNLFASDEVRDLVNDVNTSAAFSATLFSCARWARTPTSTSSCCSSSSGSTTSSLAVVAQHIAAPTQITASRSMYLPPLPKPPDPRDELVYNYKSNVIFLFFAFMATLSSFFLFLFTFIVNRYRNDDTLARKGKRVVIIGGNTAGSTAAAAITTLDSNVHVTVIEKKRVQMFTPQVPLAAAGHRSYDLRAKGPSSLFASTTWTVTREAQLVIADVKEIDPDKKIVTDDTGVQHPYDALVIASGTEQDHSPVGGFQAMDADGIGVTPGGIRDFIYHSATGNVLLVRAPYKTQSHRQCEGTWVSLVNTLWRHLWFFGRTGHAGLTDVIAITPDKTLNDTLPAAHKEELEEMWKERKIDVRTQWELQGVDRKKREAFFKDMTTGKMHTLPFRCLVVDLAMQPSFFLRQAAKNNNNNKTASLVNEHGFVTVNSETLQHTKYKDVFALGDCTDMPVAKSYGAVAAQAPVLAHNLVQHLRYDEAVKRQRMAGAKEVMPLDYDPPESVCNAKYDLYSSFHINMSTWRVMWPQMKGLDGDKRVEGFPWDDAKSWSTFGVLPGIYLQLWAYEVSYWFLFLRAHWCSPTWFQYPLFEEPEKVAKATEMALIAENSSGPNSSSVV